MNDFAAVARANLSAFQTAVAPNEAVTEERLIFPVLRSLGWDLLPQQQVTRRREDVPDALLFANADAAKAAMSQPVGSERYRLAAVIHESKRWDLALDRTTDASGRTPASQALRYLRLAEELSGGLIRWAILSNGRLWRLYAYDVTSQAERYLEADLPALVELGSEVALHNFFLLFSKGSFIPGSDGRSFLQSALVEAHDWQQAVTAQLSGAIFEDIYPEILLALSEADPDPMPEDVAWPHAVRDTSLVLLYRLLFLLYAEDRDLLPVEHDGYRPFAITTFRREVDVAIVQRRSVSSTSSTWWPRLLRLFSAIAGGNNDMGLPPYNGSLFDVRRAPLLNRVQIPDATFARVLDRLSTFRGKKEASWINYRDLSVQQLGAVYEGLLERGVVVKQGVVEPVQDDSLRHGTGAYYTPEVLVRLVTRQAVAPLLAARRETFANVYAEPSLGNRLATEKIADLQSCDPATAFLSLKICDPAMGSGHFLVSLVDWLADETLSAMVEAADIAADMGYKSPLADRITKERSSIETAAGLHGWPLDPRNLDDRQIVRRLLLKRVVYGVDLNPLAVELAKLSLWLHSFTVGAPLSYLDHHLRSGDSLFGAWIADAERLTSGVGRARRGGLALAAPIRNARNAAQAMERIEDLSDADIAQVRQSAGLFGDIEEATKPLRGFLDCLHACLWLPRPVGRTAKALGEATINRWLDGAYGDPVALANGAPPGGGTMAARVEVSDLLQKLRMLAREHRFLHWQPAFPGIWRNWQGADFEGGFDAVIGNPPYVRQEQLARMKPVLKARYAAFDGVADLYVYFFEQALHLLKPGGRFAFTVTNKWLKAGYAEALRKVLAERSWVEAITDFGHAKNFFPGTDVFPSVVCVQRPLATNDVPETVAVTVVPRDLVRMEALEAQVREGKFLMPRSGLSRHAWSLEPLAIRSLMEKMHRAGTPLAEFASEPRYGVKTGLNEAFVIDQETRDRLITEDPDGALLTRKFLRGQDIDRWSSQWAGLWMIFSRQGIDIEKYPSLLRHLKQFETRLRPKPKDWTGTAWPGRKAGPYQWYEIQDPVAYWELFSQPKILIQRILFHPGFSLDLDGNLCNDAGIFVPSEDRWLVSVLNSPIAWWLMFRTFPHKKDEALAMDIPFVRSFPIPRPSDRTNELAIDHVRALEVSARLQVQSLASFQDWLSTNWELINPPSILRNPVGLTPDRLIAALRAALPVQRRTLSAAAIGAIRDGHAEIVVPMTNRSVDTLKREVVLSDLVNSAYNLSPEEKALLWNTAPPRMPIASP